MGVGYCLIDNTPTSHFLQLALLFKFNYKLYSHFILIFGTSPFLSLFCFIFYCGLKFKHLTFILLKHTTWQSKKKKHTTWQSKIISFKVKIRYLIWEVEKIEVKLLIWDIFLLIIKYVFCIRLLKLVFYLIEFVLYLSFFKINLRLNLEMENQ